MLSNMRYHTSVIISLFGAMGTLGSSSRKLMKLGAYAERIRDMQRVMADIKAHGGATGAFGGCGCTCGSGWAQHGSAGAAAGGAGARPGCSGRALRVSLLCRPGRNPGRPPPRNRLGPAGSLGTADGQVLACEDAIVFEEAVVVTPGNTTLVRDLSLRVPAGTNLLVTGPNGAGKSSLFRCVRWRYCVPVLTAWHGVQQPACCAAR